MSNQAENVHRFGDFVVIQENLAGGGKALKAIDPWNIHSVTQGGLKHNGVVRTAYHGVSESINFSGMDFETLLIKLSEARRAVVAEILGAAMVGKITDQGMDGIVRLLAHKFGKSIEEACAVEADTAVNATLNRMVDAGVEDVPAGKKKKG